VSETLAILLILFFLLSIGLSISLSAFAFSDPRGFAHWLFIKAKNGEVFSYIIGGVLVSIAVALSFFFGSLTTTFAFGLWSSPLIRFLEFQ